MTTIDTTDSAWDELRSRVRGRLVTPGLPDWEAARTPWALNVDQQPLAVLEVADADDVAAAVRWAIGAGVPVTAQPSGHGAKRALDGTLLLRTGALREIRIDEATGTARVGAGVTWGALLQRLDGTGLIGLAGSNSDVTVVGLTLGGGLSWSAAPTGSPRTAWRPSSSWTPAARWCGSPRRPTPTCSGRCAAAAATSASWSRSTSRCSALRRSTAAGCSGPSSTPRRCCAPSARRPSGRPAA